MKTQHPSEEELFLNEQFYKFLIHESVRNDAERFLAGLRKPSRQTRRFMKGLSEVYEKRRNIYKETRKEVINDAPSSTDKRRLPAS